MECLLQEQLQERDRALHELQQQLEEKERQLHANQREASEAVNQVELLFVMAQYKGVISRIHVRENKNLGCKKRMYSPRMTFISFQSMVNWPSKTIWRW